MSQLNGDDITIKRFHLKICKRKKIININDVFSHKLT